MAVKYLESEYDPRTGVTEHYYYDDMSDTLFIQSVADISNLIASNKRAQNDRNQWIYQIT